MAWPLMELAKVLEKKEGPGHVQLFEVQDELYQLMATRSENHVVTLMKTLRQEPAGVESFSETAPLDYPGESQRIVLPARSQRREPETFDQERTELTQISQQTESKPRLKSVPAPQLEEVQMSAEPAVQSESSGGFLGDFPGAKPLIGLARVVEFRSGNGCSYCFLCHCCRIRSTNKDLIDHLTSSSHLVNYLMEIYPDQIEALGEVNEDDFQLQSLAAQVEEEEGRGEMKIVNVPESICSQLTGKSYHWCLKMLSSGGKYSHHQKTEAVAGVNKMTARHVPEKISVVMPRREKWVKPMKNKKKRKKTNTMFNVSLSIGKRELLLERRSFGIDRLLASPESPSSKLEPTASPTEMVETGCLADDPVDPVDTDSELQTSQLEQQLYREDADSGEYMSKRHITITVFQDRDGDVGDNQSGQNRPRGPQDCVRRDWKHGDIQTQSGGLVPARPPSEVWSPYHSYYLEERSGADLWSPASAGVNQAASRREGEFDVMNSSSAWQHHQHQNQQPSWAEAHTHTDSMWEHQVVPYLKAARISMLTHSGHMPVPRGSISSDPRVLVDEPEQSQAQTYSEFTAGHHHTAPQCYSTPPATFEVSPIQQRLMFYANHGALPWTNPNRM
ncbi:uncharacterized protein V3H82_019510 isoform 2-T3 [Fundulus diaphanus]